MWTGFYCTRIRISWMCYQVDKIHYLNIHEESYYWFCTYHCPVQSSTLIYMLCLSKEFGKFYKRSFSFFLLVFKSFTGLLSKWLHMVKSCCYWNSSLWSSYTVLLWYTFLYSFSNQSKNRIHENMETCRPQMCIRDSIILYNLSILINNTVIVKFKIF